MPDPSKTPSTGRLLKRLFETTPAPPVDPRAQKVLIGNVLGGGPVEGLFKTVYDNPQFGKDLGKQLLEQLGTLGDVPGSASFGMLDDWLGPVMRQMKRAPGFRSTFHVTPAKELRGAGLLTEDPMRALELDNAAPGAWDAVHNDIFERYRDWWFKKHGAQEPYSREIMDKLAEKRIMADEDLIKFAPAGRFRLANPYYGHAKDPKRGLEKSLFDSMETHGSPYYYSMTDPNKPFRDQLGKGTGGEMLKAVEDFYKKLKESTASDVAKWFRGDE